MQYRLSLSHRVFYLGLMVMLVTGVLSATVFPSGRPLMMVLTAVGAVTAILGRLWHRRLRQAIRSMDSSIDLGGYPLDLLSNPRFTSGRRPAM